jgi:hypothetical protein
LLAILLHERFRATGRWVFGAASTACFAVGLLAGEFTLGALGYLLGYALFLDRGSLGRRLLSLWPYALVLVCWRIAYQSAGYGARGSGAYVDPSSDLLTFLTVLPAKLAVLYNGALAAPAAETAFFGPVWHRPFIVAWAACMCGIALWLFWPSLRRDALARFWACGALLSAVPVSASFPSDRLLFFVGLGTMALFARVFVNELERRDGSAVPRVRRAAVFGFALLHVVLAPVLLPLRAGQMQLLGDLLDRANASISRADLQDRTVVLLGPPADVFASYISPARAWNEQPRPRHLYWLASASSAIEVRRPDADRLSVRPAEGFLFAPLEQHYRGAVRSLRAGSEVALSRMTARVTSVTADGRPQAVDFTFREPLESDAYVFLRWHEGRFVPSTLPIGDNVTLPAQDFGQVLLEHAISR